MRTTVTKMRVAAWTTAVLGVICALGSIAHAQSFPDGDERWAPLRCKDTVMTDAYRDESGAIGERDLVGNVDHAAGFRASDGEHLYLRLRLDQAAIRNGSPQPFAWGLLLDLDGNYQTYEVLLLMNGLGRTVTFYKNTTTTQPNDPTDPPDEPAVKSYEAATHARSVAAGTTWGDNDDFFLDFAIPWADLEPVGLTPSTPVVVWAATSSTSTTLNGDFACWDDASGNPTLSDTAAGRTVLDPDVDSDADGYSDAREYADGTDPGDSASRPTGTPDARQLAGGGGCSSGSGEPGTSATLAVLLALVCMNTFRRRIPPGRVLAPARPVMRARPGSATP